MFEPGISTLFETFVSERNTDTISGTGNSYHPTVGNTVGPCPLPGSVALPVLLFVEPRNLSKLVCDSGGKKVPCDLEAVKPSAISNGSKFLIRSKADENLVPILIEIRTDENLRIHVF